MRYSCILHGDQLLTRNYQRCKLYFHRLVVTISFRKTYSSCETVGSCDMWADRGFHEKWLLLYTPTGLVVICRMVQVV